MKEQAAVGRAAVSGMGQAVTVTLLWCLLGVLIPRAMLYGEMAPFGIGLAAGTDSGAVVAAVLGGYWLAGGLLSPLRYTAAVALVGGVRWVLAALPRGKENAVFPALTAFVSTLVTGIILLWNSGLDAYRVLLIVAEATVAGGCAFFFRQAVYVTRHPPEDGVLTGGEQAAVIFTAAVAVAAASTVTVGGFAPARMLAVLIVLVLARFGRESGGCVAGTVLGAALALTVPAQGASALALAFGGLLAGMFSRFGRAAQAAVLFVAAGVVVLTAPDEQSLMFVYETAGAAALFLLLPKKLDRRLCRLFLRGRDLPAAEGLRRALTMRLRVSARAMDDVADTVTQVSARLAQCDATDVHAVYREAREEVCAGCSLASVCWGEKAEELKRAMEALTPPLQENGRVSPDDLWGYPREHCRQPEALLGAINRRYDRYAARRTAWRRLEEIRGTVRGQFGGMSALLTDLAEETADPRQVDTELSSRVMAVCTDFGLTVREALCSRVGGNRLTVEILAADTGADPENPRFLRELRAVCDRELTPPTVTTVGGDVCITLTEPPRYTAECGCVRLCCDGEKLCGDAAEIFPLAGNTVVMISDGMGSGGRAAVDGAMAVGLTARLWQAGFRPQSIVRTVNAALLAKSTEESLATLDVAVIDGFTGRLDCYKAGAVSTLLYSGGRVSRLGEPSLPLGILPEGELAHTHDRLTDGDVLLMMSDGALTDGSAPVEEALRDFQPQETMQTLAERVAGAARAKQTAHQDDVTVIAVKIRRAS